jgi:hypothetical protein
MVCRRTETEHSAGVIRLPWYAKKKSRVVRISDSNLRQYVLNPSLQRPEFRDDAGSRCTGRASLLVHGLQTD